MADLFAIMIIKKCSRIPFQTQLLSINFIFSDSIGALAFIVNQCIILVFGINNDLTQNMRIVTVGTMFSVSLFSIGVLSFDRAFALKAHLRYSTMIRRRTIGFVIVFIWAFHLTWAPLSLLFGFKTKCNFQFNDNCDIWEATYPFRFSLMVLLVVVVFFVVSSNVYVYRIARHHERQIADVRNFTFKRSLVTSISIISERQFTATKAVFKIVMAFILLHGPTIIHHFVFESNVEGREDLPRRLLYGVSYFCIQISSFLNLLLYAGKFKEFKMHLYLFIGKYCTRYSRKADILKVDIYNIMVYTDSSKKQEQSTDQSLSV